MRTSAARFRSLTLSRDERHLPPPIERRTDARSPSKARALLRLGAFQPQQLKRTLSELELPRLLAPGLPSDRYSKDRRLGPVKGSVRHGRPAFWTVLIPIDGAR